MWPYPMWKLLLLPWSFAGPADDLALKNGIFDKGFIIRCYNFCKQLLKVI